MTRSQGVMHTTVRTVKTALGWFGRAGLTVLRRSSILRSQTAPSDAMQPFKLTPANRRQFMRSTFAAPASLAMYGRRFPAQILDLSLKGALVDLTASAPPPLGQRCLLRLELALGVFILMESSVAHVAGTHIGLQCEYIDLDSITHLRQLVELNAGEPELLECELGKLFAPHPQQ